MGVTWTPAAEGPHQARVQHSEFVVCQFSKEAPTDDMLAMLQQQSHQARGQAGDGAPVSLEHAAVAALAASSYDLQV